jgi:hypothetical protein
MESVSEGGRSWVLISCVGGMSSPNPDATEGCKHTSATVPYLEYYYPNYSRDPRFNWDAQIHVEQDKAVPRDPGGSNGGCKESVQETGQKPVFTANSGYREMRNKLTTEKGF